LPALSPAGASLTHPYRITSVCVQKPIYKPKPKAKRGRRRRDAFQLHADHPRSSTHEMVKLERETIVTVAGSRLADERKLMEEAESEEEQIELDKKRDVFALYILVLFKPFRSVNDIRQPTDASFWAAYLRQKDQLFAKSEMAKRFFQHSQQYHTDSGYEDKSQDAPVPSSDEFVRIRV
jgi:hypothetical protein